MTVRAGLIGLGWWGSVLADAAERGGALEIVTAFARSQVTREQFAATRGCEAAPSFEAVLEDPAIDAVILATPHSLHREMVEAAAEAGKHVFVEKPLTLEVADAQACRAAAERAGIVLQVGHHRRRQSANRRVKELLDDGSLGVVHQLEATFHVPKFQDPVSSWRADRDETPGGGMTGLGVHMLDSFHYFVGATTRVMAYSKRILGRWEIDDATVVALEFDSGPLGYLGTSLVLPKRCDVSVYGTEGVAWSEEDGTRVFRQAKDEGARMEEPVDASDALADQLIEFAACISDGGSPETGAAEAIAVVEVLQAIVESLRTGRSVDVAEVR